MLPEDGGPGRRRAWRRSHRLWSRGPGRGEPLRRRRDDRLLGGVASGLAARTGVDVMIVRLVFVLATLVSVGAAVYVLAWLFIPIAGEARNIAGKALTDRKGIALAAALGSLLVVVLVLASVLGASWIGNLAWPLVIGVAGLALIWRNAPAEEQETMRRLAEPLLGAGGAKLGLTGKGKRSATVVRASLAGVLLISGLALLLRGHASAELRPLGGLVLVVAAIMVLLGPWWLRITRNLVVERQARARAEERADMATRVHNSVLQTLALIRRNASEPQQVVKLARAQERELRSWLFDGQAPGSVRGAARTLASGVRLIQQEVEAAYGVTVEAITVGDCELDDDLDAVLAAAREATVNAAKWSGTSEVSLFAEAEPDEVSSSCATGAADSIRRRCPVTARDWPSPCAPDAPPRRLRDRPQRARRGHRGIPAHAPLHRQAPAEPGMTAPSGPGRHAANRACSSSMTTPSCGPGSGPSSATRWRSSARPTTSSPRSTDHRLPPERRPARRAPAGRRWPSVVTSVKATHPQVRFLALSASDAPEDVIAAIRAGARGYVTKTISSADLVDAVHRVTMGTRFSRRCWRGSSRTPTPPCPRPTRNGRRSTPSLTS